MVFFLILVRLFVIFFGHIASNIEYPIANISLPFLKNIIKDGIYPIILMRFIRRNGTLGALHWVVAIKVEKNYVIINDPYYKGNRKVPIKLFMKGWNGARLPKWGSAKEVLIIEK